MLVQFNFKNFASFRDEVSFDMTAVNVYQEHAYNIIEVDAKNKYLKAVAIYGANASGKSNFIKAYGCFSCLIRKSFNNNNDQRENVLKHYYRPFLFAADHSGNIEMEAVFMQEGQEYRYGFVYNEREIVCEWLYLKKLKTGRTTVILERQGLNNIRLGSQVSRECSKYIGQLDCDVLALSFFNRLRLQNQLFQLVYDCAVVQVQTLYLPESKMIKVLQESWLARQVTEADKQRLLKFLQAVDISIYDLDIRDHNDKLEILTTHLGVCGERYQVPLSIESDGTKKMIAIYFFLEDAVRCGRCLLVDELNIQLHPLLLKVIVDMFHCSENGAQLIYTTHDTTLLSYRYFRRDQVWFVDKGRGGQSELYSLAEFKLLSETFMEKEYLGGVYGAIPILHEFTPEVVE